MRVEEFNQKFAECFYQTDPSFINPETAFRQMDEWGSMMALIVIAMIDSEYGKTITAEDLKSANTITELFEIVKRK